MGSRLGGLDIPAELPQVDIDARRRRQGDHLAVDAQRRTAGTDLPARFENGPHPRQRDAEVAPGGDGVELRPHQVGQPVAAQRAGEHEQLEQRTHSPAP